MNRASAQINVAKARLPVFHAIRQLKLTAMDSFSNFLLPLTSVNGQEKQQRTGLQPKHNVAKARFLIFLAIRQLKQTAIAYWLFNSFDFFSCK